MDSERIKIMNDKIEIQLVKLTDGGRLLRLRPLLVDGTFMVTYGDGLSDIDIRELVAFHRQHGRLATVTAVRPPARFGAMHLDGDRVQAFSEKSQASEGWINGGFFVFEPQVLEYIDDDTVPLERAPLDLSGIQ